MISSQMIVEVGSLAVVGLTSVIVTYGVAKLVTKLISKIYGETEENQEQTEANLLEAMKPGNLWNTVMFFPDHFSGNPDSTSQQFLWYFAQARVSIQVCIYNFSFPELESVIVQQFKRGLIVEFVVGHKMTADALRYHNIPCGMIPRLEETPDTDQIMHNKFAIIDEQAVLSGSLNWTTESIVRNRENVVVTTDRGIVKKYLQEFVKLKMKCEKARMFY